MANKIGILCAVASNFEIDPQYHDLLDEAIKEGYVKSFTAYELTETGRAAIDAYFKEKEDA